MKNHETPLPSETTPTEPPGVVSTVSNGVDAALTTCAHKEKNNTDAVLIPDSESAALFDSLVEAEHIDVITPTREGEGVAIAAGLQVGGRKPILIIQNTGLMEAGDALRGCSIGPKIPLRLLVGWRGYVGAMAGRLPMDSAYAYTEPLLAAWGIPTRTLMSNDDLGMLSEMDAEAQETSLPSAVLTGWPFR